MQCIIFGTGLAGSASLNQLNRMSVQTSQLAAIGLQYLVCPNLICKMTIHYVGSAMVHINCRYRSSTSFEYREQATGNVKLRFGTELRV